jgi:hypothetical protein
MGRTKKDTGSARRLLTLWEPPEKAGAPRGVIATTFTLDTTLFEEECLARFAGVQSEPSRDGALYRIEREEKLASLDCAAVIADIHHCAGRRSLRWDLLAARPESGVMHAKISLLVWQDWVRVIVASANLTQDGYRRNQECASVLEFNDHVTDRGLLNPLLEFLKELLKLTSGPARARARDLLDWVDKRLPKHDASPRGLQRRMVFVGPKLPSLFEQASELMPGSPGEAHVVSPFFDPGLRDNGPEKTLWSLMRQRGPATVHLHVAGEESPETRGWRLAIGSDVLKATPTNRSEAFTQIHPIRVTEVETEFGQERRPLHAKMMTLSHPDWIAWIVGSSNFTSAGSGLSKFARNYEANVLYLLRAPEGDGTRKLMESRALRGADAVDLNDPSLEFEPAIDPADAEQGIPPLPGFFAEAELTDITPENYSVTLRFDGEPPAETWSLRHDQKLVFDDSQWLNAGSKPAMDLLLPREGPPPSFLTAQWNGVDGSEHVADWPINVLRAQVLPAPEELQGLSLAALLELLSSARPLHEAIRGWLRRQPDDDDADVDETIEVIDPHAKVDTSRFLVKRVQRCCWAMQQLRSRLEQPVPSLPAMGWRLDGPVGARAVLAAMKREADPALPDEWVFLLCEFFREMSKVRLRGLDGKAAPSEMRRMLESFVAEVRAGLDQALLPASPAMQAFVVDALRGFAREAA